MRPLAWHDISKGPGVDAVAWAWAALQHAIKSQQAYQPPHNVAAVPPRVVPERLPCGGERAEETARFPIYTRGIHTRRLAIDANTLVARCHVSPGGTPGHDACFRVAEEVGATGKRKTLTGLQVTVFE